MYQKIEKEANGEKGEQALIHVVVLVHVHWKQVCMQSTPHCKQAFSDNASTFEP